MINKIKERLEYIETIASTKGEGGIIVLPRSMIEALRVAIGALDQEIMSEDCECDQCRIAREALIEIGELIGVNYE